MQTPRESRSRIKSTKTPNYSRLRALFVISVPADSLMACRVLTHHAMHGTYTLRSPIVAFLYGTTSTTTLPSRASVEIRQNSQTTLVQVRVERRDFVVHLSDLLDARRVEDVGEIACR
jgi:hypothetical protein